MNGFCLNATDAARKQLLILIHATLEAIIEVNEAFKAMMNTCLEGRRSLIETLVKESQFRLSKFASKSFKVSPSRLWYFARSLPDEPESALASKAVD
jgi:hypothetical protein